MGNILTYNKRTNELVARNTTPSSIVKYIYQFTFYGVNFSENYVYYLAANWSITSSVNADDNTLKDITFTYTGTQGTEDSKFYTLNLAPYQALKIVQFSRLNDLTRGSFFEKTTTFKWVSKEGLGTENIDDYNTLLDDDENRDYSISFIGTDHYIEDRIIHYEPNTGTLSINNTSLDTLNKVSILNVNPIGTSLIYSSNIVFDYLHNDWSYTTTVSSTDSSKLDYHFTYTGGNGNLAISGNTNVPFVLAKFYQTKNQQSSNINSSSIVLAIETPMETGTSIYSKTLIDKIIVNTVESNGELEIAYDITPLTYLKSQALLQYSNNEFYDSWGFTNESKGLRGITINNVNLSENSILPNTAIKNESGWTFSITNYDGTADTTSNVTKNLTMTYSGASSYGYDDSHLVTFFKLFDRQLSNGLTNIKDTTVVTLVVEKDGGEYTTQGYFMDVSLAETVEYIGCPKMLNYNPVSGLLKFNGTVSTIPGIYEFSMLIVNLDTVSNYDDTATTWDISDDIITVFGNATYNDITIRNSESGTFPSSGNIVKFSEVSNESVRSSNITENTIISINLGYIKNSGFTVSYGGTVYVDLINIANPNGNAYTNGDGIEYWALEGSYIEYTKEHAQFDVVPLPSLNNPDYLRSIKKFVIKNVNATHIYSVTKDGDDTDWRYGPYGNWIVTSTGSGSSFNVTATRDSVLDFTSSSTDVGVFRFTRTAVLLTASNITENTIIEVYFTDVYDEEENYFVHRLGQPSGIQEYINGGPIVSYSKYSGELTLKSATLSSVSKITFFNVNVDKPTSIFAETATSSSSVAAANTNYDGAFDLSFDWGSNVSTADNTFVRFNRLGNGVTMNDLSSSNINADTLVLFDNFYLTLLSVSDESDFEYYSKSNYIKYHAGVGEVRLRRSILDSIYAVEFHGLGTLDSSLHFKNTNWTFTDNNSNLKITYNGDDPYAFPDGETEDYEVPLFTIYQTTTGIDSENTGVRLYIKNATTTEATEVVETVNTIDKVGDENDQQLGSGIDYYMKTGSVFLKASSNTFSMLYKFVIYGINVNQDCIFSRTFNGTGEDAANNPSNWIFESTPNFYNPEYVDLSVTYRDSNGVGVSGDQSFMFQFFKTLTRSKGSSEFYKSKAAEPDGSRKSVPVTWYRTSESNDHGFTGFFIANGNGTFPDEEYFSDVIDVLKHYNNTGLTEINAVAPRFGSIKSITLLDVNFSVSELNGPGSDATLVYNSFPSGSFQDFTMTFPTAHSSFSNVKPLIRVYDFYNTDVIDFNMKNDTIVLINDGNDTFPLLTLEAANIEYYKLGLGLISYSPSNGDLNFLSQTVDQVTINKVYKIELAAVNATVGQVIVEYGAWKAESRRIGALYTLTFTYTPDPPNDTGYDQPADGDDFINIVLLLGYYSPIYGSALINSDTVATIVFDKNDINSDTGVMDKDKIVKGKVVRFVAGDTDYDVTFAEIKTYPVPSNLYTRYKDYTFLFLAGNIDKTGQNNTFITIFDGISLTETNGINVKTSETVFKEHKNKIHMVRYTVLKSKTAPYDFTCEQSGYTSFDANSTNPQLGTIYGNLQPTKKIKNNSAYTDRMSYTLGNGNHINYEVLNSLIVVVIPKYDGTMFSSNVKKLLKHYGVDIMQKGIEVNDCYLSVLFVNNFFNAQEDLKTFSTSVQNEFAFSQRSKTTIVFENADNKVVTAIPYGQMRTYMKYDYEPIKNMGNSVRLPHVMGLESNRTLGKYRDNAMVYNVNVFT